MNSKALRFNARIERAAFTLEAAIIVEPGEVVAVIGPNGAGKSTLLRSISGLVPLTSGSIEIGGVTVDDPARDILTAPESRRVGVVFQDYLLFPHMSVADNIAFGPRAAGVGRRQARELAGDWITRLSLTGLADRKPSELSGGQSQRVALARALACDPAVLLLDEPLAALDAGTRIDVRAELREHLAFVGIPTLLVTHDPLDALVLAERIVVLEQGRITQEGLALDVARRPATTYVARLLGLNLLPGQADDGRVTLTSGGEFHTAQRNVSGAVLVAVRPDAISIHTSPPSGSARNVWRGTVEGVEPIGDRVRVTAAGPPTVMADVTAASVVELQLTRGTPVWLSTKATELEVYPAGGTAPQ